MKNGNGRVVQIAILAGLVVVVVAGVIAAVFAKERVAEILGFCTVVVVSLLGLLQANKTSSTAHKIHTLTNSAMGAQLRLNSVMAKRIADESKKPADAEAATLAAELYADHQAKQAIVDSGR